MYDFTESQLKSKEEWESLSKEDRRNTNIKIVTLVHELISIFENARFIELTVYDKAGDEIFAHNVELVRRE